MNHEEAYFIEVDNNGCRCGAGRTWTVIGPDGYGIGKNFEDADGAAYWCEQLNGAYLAGESHGLCGTSKTPPGWHCKRTAGHSGPCAAHNI